ncbi:pyridoxal phosphate-dependent aminotransferase [Bariatricus massiliensis]|uniref:cysteine-S-conjugate beta-lyase n=1 Tax=Bariatricus massiliensis TaxID=1745713 RepID=A0ABS8DKN2_9FIRM|nr:MalY/PatB family protein [Bariatricus massiliensis]MCB7305573.1 pyridoxal phosphate-dependent aminotransferase [Bariatricus massiliensis]MCB7376127.1 pyridoxal phosphate-dependent aminotransferase [Bariatricus massiliensis]MCB7388759.1 pyridoxal phosphate-dependent aminotransferase [Bariatricus massiliensis]MCB7412932.1 pyridoxal phosphate-dependent aminotransferase [Bariatricus massiliensis]MCQ5253238.1 pyridoxal phosphate-dependent aminotransferase [Bariatricus massiliensis]
MKYDFDQVIDRHNTNSMKWDCGEMIKEFGVDIDFDEDTIAIFTADMDFRCAQPIIDAMDKVVQHGIFGYSGSFGNPAYKNAIIRWFKDRHDWEIAPESISFINGTVEATSIAVQAYTKEGEGVLITRPVYGPFTGSIEENNRRVVNSELINTDGYYTMDFDDIEEKAKAPDVTMFLLCSPHNPTGRVWTVEELSRLADICERNGLVLVSDEVHCDILRKGVTFTTAAKVGKPENTVVLNAINKTFNCAGLQCSHAIIPDEVLREKYKEVCGWRMPNPFAIEATIAAYTEGDEWLDQVLDYIDGTFDWVLAFLAKEMPRVKARRPEGTYVLWMDFRGTGLTPEEIHDRIYKKANVCLESGAMFDPELGTGFERVCLPSSRTLIEKAFRRIAAQFADCK